MAEDEWFEKRGAYLTVGEAAAFLGVSPSTLRNWDRAGRVGAARHPINRDLLYCRKELLALLEEVVLSDPQPGETCRAGCTQYPLSTPHRK